MAFTRNGTSYDQSSLRWAAVHVIALVVLLFFLPDSGLVDGLVMICTCMLMLVVRPHFAFGREKTTGKLVEPKLAEKSACVVLASPCERAVDDVCYNAAVQAWANAGYPRQAECWLRKAIGAGCKISAPSYASACAAFKEAGLTSEAERWCKLSDIAARAVSAGQPTKSSSIDDMSKVQQLFDEVHEEVSGACDTFAESRSQGANPISVTSKQCIAVAYYNAVVQVWAEAGYPRQAECWLRKAIGAGCKISAPSYAIVVASFREAGLTTEAERWCKLSDIAARAAPNRQLAKSMQ